jgi:hypothetical protein
MDHLGITNTVDSTSAFKVAGVATADLSGTCLVRENATMKIGYKNILSTFLSLF